MYGQAACITGIVVMAKRIEYGTGSRINILRYIRPVQVLIISGAVLST